MSVDMVFGAVESVLQTAGRTLLEITAVLVLSYLLVFVGSLLLAAFGHAARWHPRRAALEPFDQAPAAALARRAVAGAGH